MADDELDAHFVEYGTPVAQLSENDSISKLASENQQKAQKVTDKQGRVRFHGAFTGGYSAGFYNTVGTEEGWAPKTFKSSRRGQQDGLSGARPEDFMDDEDVEEFGIAPRRVQTSENYSHNQSSTSNQRAAWESVVPELSSTLDDVFRPVKMTKAVKILRLMGWKEGQGMGPRFKRKVKTLHGKNVLGPSLPPSMAKPTVDSDDSDDYEVSDDITFAPKDLNPIDFAAKDNLYGIGYEPLHRAPEARVLSASQQEEERLMFGGKRGISGQAFEGADEDDDDNHVYTKDSMSNYDKILGGENVDSFSHISKRSSKVNSGSQSSSVPTFTTSSQILKGFALATKTDKPHSRYPLPHLPQGYVPAPPKLKSAQSQPKILGKLDGNLRRLLLGDKNTDAALLPECKLEPKSESLLPDKHEVPVSLERVSRFAPIVAADATEDMNAEEKLPLPPTRSSKPLNTQSVDFKPFSKYPEKQTRYSKYLALKQHGRRDAYNMVAPPEFSALERDREREEFERSGSFYRSLTGIMASRFTRPKLPDDVDSKVRVRVDEEFDDYTDEKKEAVNMKMFGELTRESYEWHPHRLLCKRFNVPDPYPESQLVGLPTVEQDKISFSNFLDVQSFTQTAEERKAANIDVSRESKKEDLISQHIEKKDKRSSVEEERPSMDLFSAVFASDASESDSDDEVADENIQQMSEDVTNETPVFQPADKPIPNIKAEYAKPRTVASLYTDSEATEDPVSRVSLDDFKPKFVSKKQRTKDTNEEVQSRITNTERQITSGRTPNDDSSSPVDAEPNTPPDTKNKLLLPQEQTSNKQLLPPSDQYNDQSQTETTSELSAIKIERTGEISDEELAWMPALPPNFSTEPVPGDVENLADLKEHRHKKHKHKEKHKKKKAKKSQKSSHR